MAPINPPNFVQAGTYSARLDRLSQAGLLPGDPAVGALAVRGGVRPAPSNTGLQVTQRSTPAMFVTIAAGVGYVPASSAVGGCYVVCNDASYDVAIAASHATLARRDLVVAQVRDAEYSGVNNDWQLSVVTGTPAGSPVLPATPAGAVALAQVQVGAAVSTIVNANITDLRTFAVASGGVVPVPTTARPGSPYEGMAIYDTTINRPYWYDGSTWRSYADEGYLTTSDLASYLSANGYVTSSYLTSNNYLTQANLDATTWTSYTPTWGASTTNPSVGNGTIVGRYFKIGKWCNVHIGLNLGSTSGVGSGTYSFSIPSFTPAAFLTGGFFYSSGSAALNRSGTGAYLATSYLFDLGSGNYRVRLLTAGTTEVTHNSPFVWANGDDLDINFTFQIA